MNVEDKEIDKIEDKNTADNKNLNAKELEIESKKLNEVDNKNSNRHELGTNLSDSLEDQAETDGLSEKTIGRIWKIIFSNNLEIFIQMTDLIVCLKDSTYSQLMNNASEFSLYKDPAKLSTVLAAKGNNHFYKRVYKKSSLEPVRKEETYFDFLVVQNELIKAQENIRLQLQQRIEMLEDHNSKLKAENSELKGSLERIKQQLSETKSD